MTVVKKPLRQMMEEVGQGKIVYNLSGSTEVGYGIYKTDLLEASRHHQIPTDPLMLAFHNIFFHNDEERNVMFSIKFIRGERGFIVGLKNSGIGFDHNEVQKKYQEGALYFKNHGYGFECYNSKGIEVSFENHGRAVNILIPENSGFQDSFLRSTS